MKQAAAKAAEKPHTPSTSKSEKAYGLAPAKCLDEVSTHSASYHNKRHNRKHSSFALPIFKAPKFKHLI